VLAIFLHLQTEEAVALGLATRNTVQEQYYVFGWSKYCRENNLLLDFSEISREGTFGASPIKPTSSGTGLPSGCRVQFSAHSRLVFLSLVPKPFGYEVSRADVSSAKIVLIFH